MKSILILAIAATLLSLMVVVYLYPPETVSFLPKCVFHEYTGLHCPGCGGTRAVHRLMHGDFAAAIHMNALAVFLLPLILLRLAWQYVVSKRRDMPTQLKVPYYVDWIIAGLVVAFGILRNIPYWPFNLIAPF